MSYTVRGMRGDSAKVVEEFGSLEEARVLFEQLKTSDRYSSVELDDITDPDNPDMVDIVELGGVRKRRRRKRRRRRRRSGCVRTVIHPTRDAKTSSVSVLMAVIVAWACPTISHRWRRQLRRGW